MAWLTHLRDAIHDVLHDGGVARPRLHRARTPGAERDVEALDVGGRLQGLWCAMDQRTCSKSNGVETLDVGIRLQGLWCTMDERHPTIWREKRERETEKQNRG